MVQKGIPDEVKSSTDVRGLQRSVMVVVVVVVEADKQSKTTY